MVTLPNESLASTVVRTVNSDENRASMQSEIRQQMMSLPQQRRQWSSTLIVLVIGLAASSCIPLSGRLRSDPPGTSLNAKTSQWVGRLSSGGVSDCIQISTGLNRFSFKETWTFGANKDRIVTIGRGSYEPSTGINIYEYSQPQGVVVAKTREGINQISTHDTILASTIPFFKPGESITYTLKSP